MSSPVLSVLGNCVLGGLALASLFGTWSQQKLFSSNAVNDLTQDISAGKTNALVSWTHTLFQTTACDVFNKAQYFQDTNEYYSARRLQPIVAYESDYLYVGVPNIADAPPLDCTKFDSVLEFLTLGGLGVEQKSFAIVSAAFAVIATIFAVINMYSCANALLQSAFGDAGIPIKNAVSWGWLFNFAGALSWIISWAAYTHFASLLHDQIAVYEENDGRDDEAYSNTYGYGFALAVIMSGLTIIVGVINLLVARASVNATGAGTVSGNWFAFSTVLAIATACIAIGGMVSPWFELSNFVDHANPTGAPPDGGLSLGSPWADSSRQTIGLYYSEDCSWSHFATFVTNADMTEYFPATPENNVVDATSSDNVAGVFVPNVFFILTDRTPMIELDCVEAIATSADYSYSQNNAGYENEDVTFQNLSAVMGAFQAAATVFAWFSVFIQLAVVMRIKAGDASAVTCTGWFSSQTAFWVSLINTILSCITWPIAAYMGWTLIAPYTEDPETIDFNWRFSSGFVLAVLGGITSFFSTLTAYWSLSTVGAAPESSTAAASFVHAFFTGAPGAAALPKPVLVSKPRAGTAAIATLRSSLISVANAGTAFAALFGTWQTTLTVWAPTDNSDANAEIQVAASHYSLNSFVECNVFNWISGGVNNFDTTVLECNEFTFQDYYWNNITSGNFQYQLNAATLAFTIISAFVALVAAYLAILAALGKPSASAHYANVVTAIIGLITWPIAYACYIKSLAIDYDQGIFNDGCVNGDYAVDGVVVNTAKEAACMAAWESGSLSRWDYAEEFIPGVVQSQSFEGPGASSESYVNGPYLSYRQSIYNYRSQFTVERYEQQTDSIYGPAFAQAILSQVLCFVWLVDYFVWTKAEEAGVDAEEKAAESPA